MRFLVACGLVLATGCSSSPATNPPGDAADTAPPPVDAAGIVAARPYTLRVPPGYDPSKPTPLVVMFHGYSALGVLEEALFGFNAASDKYGFLYAYGEGTTDRQGKQFWNATDACCDLDHSSVDDVTYFDAIVADVASKKNVDRKRVFAIGHSNGGFMSHRLACDRAGTVAAIVSLAGAVWLDASKCNPSAKVAIAEVHGDDDRVILYNGGTASGGGAYPSAAQTVSTWASKNGCTRAIADTGQSFDLDSVLAGNETTVAAYGACPAGIDVQLWTIHGGGHVPNLTHPGWGDAVWGFLSAHPRP